MKCSRAIDFSIFVVGERCWTEFAQFDRTIERNIEIVHEQLLLLELSFFFHKSEVQRNSKALHLKMDTLREREREGNGERNRVKKQCCWAHDQSH